MSWRVAASRKGSAISVTAKAAGTPAPSPIRNSAAERQRERDVLAHRELGNQLSEPIGNRRESAM